MAPLDSAAFGRRSRRPALTSKLTPRAEAFDSFLATTGDVSVNEAAKILSRDRNPSAVLNALPLPLLDGGQFVFLMLEGLRGKPLPEKFQLAFMQSGFVFLVGLSLVLIVKDTSQLAAVQQLLGR